MTIKDLAAQTGYSVGTVSRVLNHQPNVSPKAREVILRAAEKSGFHLNTNAKQLRQQHGDCILAVVKGRSNDMFSALVEAIQSRFSHLRYPLIVDYLDEDQNEVDRAVQLCTEKKPLGVFFLGGNQENFRRGFGKIDVPCVLVTNSAVQLPFSNLSSVCTDDLRASREAMDVLLALGHREIVIIGGRYGDSDTSRLRYDGCMESLRQRGIDFDEKRDYISSRFSYQDGYDAMLRLLQTGRKFTAVFALADVIAIGAIRALREKGLSVPEDVSVMGYDGLPLGDFLVPQLSTVDQPVIQMAQRSVDILLDCIEQGGVARHETVPYTVCQRESTGEI